MPDNKEEVLRGFGVVVERMPYKDLLEGRGSKDTISFDDLNLIARHASLGEIYWQSVHLSNYLIMSGCQVLRFSGMCQQLTWSWCIAGTGASWRAWLPQSSSAGPSA